MPTKISPPPTSSAFEMPLSPPCDPPNPGRTTRKDTRTGRKRPELNHCGFLGVDGEGYRNEQGEEVYWLLRCGDRQLEAEPGKRLTTEQCLEFLFSCKKTSWAFVGFALNYDWDHILRDLSDEKFSATRAKDSKRGAWWGTKDYKYLIKRCKCKFVTITRWPQGGGKGERITVFDTFSFFQCSFLDALTTWKIGTEGERDFIREMKELRNDFANQSPDRIVNYNALECSLLAALMTKFDKVVQDAIGIRLASWHGPGALAKAALKKFDIALSIKEWQETDLPADFEDAACRAFFGGWFQLFRVGHFDQCRQVDINSAYPDQTRNLPALGGKVRHTTEYDSIAYGCWHVRWNIPVHSDFTPQIWPLPYRTKDGMIHRPPQGNGWYWQDEVEAAKIVYGDAIEVIEGWVYEPPTDERPFEDLVNNLYQVRMQLGKATEGIPIKLFLNSIYGVLAQSPIHGDKALGCVMWAGMITSGTRAKLFRAAVQNPSAAIYAATDGLLTEALPNLPFSKNLGEWDCEEYTSAQVYQPGVYHLKGENPKVKVRGLRKDEPVDWEQAAAEWARHGCEGALTVTTGDRYLTRDLAIHFGHQPYRWRPEVKTLSFHPGVGFRGNLREKGPNYRWESWDLWKQDYLEVPSAPYDKLAEVTAAIREQSAIIRENYCEE